MIAEPDLSLVAIDSNNWRTTLHVRVPDHQLRFVADYQPIALVLLAKAFVRPGGLIWDPFAIMRGREAVGLVALAHTPDLAECNECEILHFVIDEHWQHLGIGRAAFDLIITHVRTTLPAVRSLIVSVDPDNEVGRHLYIRLGFQATGLERMGEPLLRLSVP